MAVTPTSPLISRHVAHYIQPTHWPTASTHPSTRQPAAPTRPPTCQPVVPTSLLAQRPVATPSPLTCCPVAPTNTLWLHQVLCHTSSSSRPLLAHWRTTTLWLKPLVAQWRISPYLIFAHRLITMWLHQYLVTPSSPLLPRWCTHFNSRPHLAC